VDSSFVFSWRKVAVAAQDRVGGKQVACCTGSESHKSHKSSNMERLIDGVTKGLNLFTIFTCLSPLGDHDFIDCWF